MAPMKKQRACSWMNTSRCFNPDASSSSALICQGCMMSSLCRDALRHWFGFMACYDGLLLPFVFAQRRHFHLGLARICPRHGLAVMSKIHLGIPFWIARCLRPFRPSVTVAVQRHAFDAKSIAALLELRGAVARADGAQIRK